jgi:hypothetical protein
MQLVHGAANNTERVRSNAELQFKRMNDMHDRIRGEFLMSYPPKSSNSWLNLGLTFARRLMAQTKRRNHVSDWRR